MHTFFLCFLKDVALSPQELLGLKAIVLYLHQLPIQRKNVPALIYDPVALLKSIRQIVEMHRYDDPAKAVTGKPILIWPGERAEVFLSLIKIFQHFHTILYLSPYELEHWQNHSNPASTTI